jgi:hypothetical protein
MKKALLLWVIALAVVFCVATSATAQCMSGDGIKIFYYSWSFGTENARAAAEKEILNWLTTNKAVVIHTEVTMTAVTGAVITLIVITYKNK